MTSLFPRSLIMLALIVVPVLGASAQTDRYPVPPIPEKIAPQKDYSHTPGATGRTIVRGDHSTVAGDHAATIEQRTK